MSTMSGNQLMTTFLGNHSAHFTKEHFTRLLYETRHSAGLVHPRVLYGYIEMFGEKEYTHTSYRVCCEQTYSTCTPGTVWHDEMQEQFPN